MDKSSGPHINLLVSVVEYITWLFKVFGVIPESQPLGFPAEGGYNFVSSTNNFYKRKMIYSENLSAHNKEEIVMPYLKALIDFREEVRTCARAEKNIAMLKVRRRI